MIERVEYLDFLKKLKDKKVIKVVTGVRGCGKSTLFSLYKDYLLTQGIGEKQIISMNFENPEDAIYDDWKTIYDMICQHLVSL